MLVLRYCFGMLMSESILMIGSDAATPVRFVNFSIDFLDNYLWLTNS